MKIPFELVKYLAEQSLVGIILLQEDKIIHANRRIAEIMETTPQEIMSWSAPQIFDYVHPDVSDKVMKNYVLRISSSERVEENHPLAQLLERRLITTKGKTKWVLSSIKTCEINGKITLQILFFDISEQKQVELGLRAHIKERDCLYAISQFGANAPPSIDAFLQGMLTLIAPGFQFPSLIAVKILFDDIFVQSENYIETPWKLIENDIINGKILEITVIYLQKKSFIQEEKEMLRVILRRVKSMIHHIETEKNLTNSENRYRDLYENAPIAYFSIGKDRKIRNCNNAATLLLGFSREDLFNMEVFELYADTVDGIQKARELFARFQMGEEFENQELQMKKKNGEIIWVSLSVKPIKNKEEKVIESRSIVLNIDKDKKVQQRLKESEERFRNIIENAPFGYYRMGKDSTWQYVNPVWEKMIGYSLEEVVGKSLEITQPENAQEAARNIIKKCLAGESVSGELARTRKDGTIEYHMFNVQPVYHKNEVLAIEGFINDITERKKAELLVKKSEDMYKQAYTLANLYKDLFAHDMSNILHAILSIADYYIIFRNQPEKLDKIGDIAELVKKQVLIGSQLISNVRKLAKVEETKLKLKPMEFKNILSDSINHVCLKFQDRNVNVTVTGLMNGIRVLANDFLVDIFENLLDNAVKFNYDEKEVKIEINISRNKEEKIQYIVFEFKDHGIGIPDHKKEQLFTRIDINDVTLKGMGLGLSLIKKIVDTFKGKIWIENRVKEDYTKGSNFILMLCEA